MRYFTFVATAFVIIAAEAGPGHTQSITRLLTAQERADAGLSKLTPAELAALDAALLRVLAEMSAVLPVKCKGKFPIIADRIPQALGGVVMIEVKGNAWRNGDASERHGR